MIGGIVVMSLGFILFATGLVRSLYRPNDFDILNPLIGGFGIILIGIGALLVIAGAILKF